MTVEFEANVLYQVKKKSNNKSVRLASLYHFMMESLFTEYGFEFGIFLEDDLQISPDFIEYFSLLAPLMKRDASLFCVSAFNDNGFYVSAKDESQLYRGEVSFFFFFLCLIFNFFFFFFQSNSTFWD